LIITRPKSVGVTPRDERSNNWTPSESSSSLMLFVAAGCAMFSA